MELDRQLKENLFREGTRTGATAAIVIITPSAIISASAGDSRSVLATENEGHICLSSDHKPTHVCIYMHLLYNYVFYSEFF